MAEGSSPDRDERATAFDVLRADVLACRRCEEAGYLPRANPIPAHPWLGQRLLLIGQAPGPVTDRRGYHFAGPAGSILDGWFQRAGFAPGAWRKHALLSSLTRCFPGKAAMGQGDRAPSPAEIALCRPFLDRERMLARPMVVVLVGRMAIDAYLGVGKRPLTETVGRACERDACWYVPLPHASGVSRWLNDPAHRQLVESALASLDDLRRTYHLDEAWSTAAENTSPAVGTHLATSAPPRVGGAHGPSTELARR